MYTEIFTDSGQSGECRLESNGDHGIRFGKYTSLDECKNTCNRHAWCAAIQTDGRDQWHSCKLIVDAKTWNELGMTFDNDRWGGSQTIDGDEWQTYCGGSGDPKCATINTPFGRGSVLSRGGYNCYVKTDKNTEANVSNDDYQEILSNGNESGVCTMPADGKGIKFSRDYHDLSPHEQKDADGSTTRRRCQAECDKHDWCVAIETVRRDDSKSPSCKLIVDAKAWKTMGMTFDHDKWGGIQTIDGDEWHTYCDGAQNIQTENGYTCIDECRNNAARSWCSTEPYVWEPTGETYTWDYCAPPCASITQAFGRGNVRPLAGHHCYTKGRDESDCSDTTYYNLAKDSATYKTCVPFGTRCAETGSDDCNPNEGQYCHKPRNGERVCVNKKPDDEQCTWSNECQSNMCQRGRCDRCNSEYDCDHYIVPGTNTDRFPKFERAQCKNGTCVFPFKNGA